MLALCCRALLDFKSVLAYSVAHGCCSAVGNHSQVAPPQGCCIMARLLRATCGAGNMLSTPLHSVERSFVRVDCMAFIPSLLTMASSDGVYFV